ncbi:MAG: nuclear transport factor 2 family protein [Sphingomonadaceae bacterium]
MADASASDFIQAPTEGPGPDHIRWAMETYGKRMGDADLDGVLALFHPNAVIEDPIGTGEKRGHAGIGAFFQAGFDAMQGGILLTLDGAVRVVGRYGAVAYIATPVNYPVKVEIETLDVMEFDDAGLIVRMTAFWGETNRKILS